VTGFAVKAVTDSYLSCFHDGSGILDGILPASWRAQDADAGTAWSTIALDYSVGNTVTPDAELELAVKLASSAPTIREKAARSGGLRAWIDDPDLPESGDALRRARGTAKHLRVVKRDETEVFPPGRVVIVSYEPEDVIEVDPPHVGWPRVSTLRLRSCVVTEELDLDA
jgi:hypothetical protein